MGVDAQVFDNRTYKSLNPLVRWYFYKLLKEAVQMTDLSEGDTVLDFGCNEQRLQNFLPPIVDYVGFDVDERFTDVSDYKEVRPSTVFAINVFEHLEPNEFDDVLQHFNSVGVKEIVVGNPTDNLLSAFAKLFLGLSEAVNYSHILDYDSVVAHLHFNGWNEVQGKTVLTFNRVGKWVKRRGV